MRERGVEFDVIDYIKQPLSREVLEGILEKLETPAGDLIRKDKAFDELGLNAGNYGDDVTAEAVAALLLAHPKLMQRPVAVQGDRAVIARPADRVRELDLGAN